MMKKYFVSLLCLLCALAMLLSGIAGCTGNSGGEKTDPDSTLPGSAGTSDNGTASSDTQPDTEAKPNEVIDGSSVFGDGYNANMLVGFDEYGRVLEPTLARKDNKDVGIFYFLWLGTPHFPDIYDIAEILKTHGKDTVFYQDSEVSPKNQAHWWSQPLFGYYNRGDEWVIRKHMEMLTMAGVDFLVFDTTNAVTYDAVARRIMKISAELRAEGWDAPQVAYMTHTYSIATINQLYENIYKKYPEYEEAWYKIDGKPMIIGYQKEADDIKSSGDTRDGQPYRPGDLSQELLDFFHVRDSRWPGEPATDNTWPYTDWELPPAVNGDMMTVSVATHPRPPFSYGMLYDTWYNYGRGYNVATGQNNPEDALRGVFFDYEWEAVHKNADKLDYVFICAWNQWVAWKLDIEGYDGYIYVDSADMQYSFDIEPMLGGFEDAYYIQMMSHIRRYKYDSLTGKTALTLHKTIDINGSAAQWEDVDAVYRRVGQDDGKRGKYGASKTVDYACDPVKNNIVEVRATSDDQNLYFMIKTTEPITEVTDGTSNRMNIFIGRGRPEAGKGWEGYEFAINRTRSGSTAAIESLRADYSGGQVGEATFSVQGNILQIAIPREAVGLADGGDFYFKVADGVENPEEIMNYYGSGRSLPLGRLSYLYQIGD